MNQEIKKRIEMINRGEIPIGYKKTKLGIIPVDWELEKVKEIMTRIRNPVNVQKNTSYRQIGIRSHGKGIFYKEEVSGEVLGNKSVFWIEPDCFIVNIVFAWELAVSKTTEQEVGMIASHRFPMYKPINERLDLNYVMYLFKTPLGKYLLELASPGGAGRNKTLGQKEFLRLNIPLPKNVREQQKISKILLTWDKAIELKEKLIDQKKLQKKEVMKKLILEKVRLTGFGNEWDEVKLKDIISYSRPDKYSVKEIGEYNEQKIPVLTANKSFILGYSNETNKAYENTPVIIFDDFTTDNKYVDFKFLVKSSAIKILRVNDYNYDLRFIFEAFKYIRFNVSEHKRYYISEYQYNKIRIPKIEEQKAISEVSFLFENEIKLLMKELEELKEQKKGLMQLLLTGKVRVKL